MSKRIKERVKVGEDANGKPLYEWATGYDRQEVLLSAAQIILRYQKTENTQTQAAPHTPYFETYTEEWWRLYKMPKLRHTTLTTYRNLLDAHILPYFKGKRLEEITTNTLQQFYNEHADMARSTVRQMAVLLHQIFDLAVEDGHMRFNLTESKRLSMSNKKTSRRALEDGDVREIIRGLSALEGEERSALALLLFTGMRRGEMLALRWESIDWKRRLLTVERAVTFAGNRPVIGETKSEAGRRLIPLDERLAALLAPYRQLSGFVIGGGAPLTETAFKRLWERIGKKINLHGATPHVFRHTYITLAASSGVDVKTLQAIAGHSDIKMTMNRYAHGREEKIIKAGKRISDVFAAL